MIPITFLIVPFAAPIIALLLGRGRFDAGAVEMTAQALVAYGAGLVGVAMLYVLQRAFYALGKNALLLAVGAIAALAHVGLNLVLMQTWQHAGIALSTSLTAIAQAVILIALLGHHLPTVRLVPLFSFLAQCALLGAVSTAIVLAVRAFMPFSTGTLTANLADAALAVFGGSIYCALALIARVPESRMVLHNLTRLVKR